MNLYTNEHMYLRDVFCANLLSFQLIRHLKLLKLKFLDDLWFTLSQLRF